MVGMVEVPVKQPPRRSPVPQSKNKKRQIKSLEAKLSKADREEYRKLKKMHKQVMSDAKARIRVQNFYIKKHRQGAADAAKSAATHRRVMRVNRRRERAERRIQIEQIKQLKALNKANRAARRLSHQAHKARLKAAKKGVSNRLARKYRSGGVRSNMGGRAAKSGSLIKILKRAYRMAMKGGPGSLTSSGGSRSLGGRMQNKGFANSGRGGMTGRAGFVR